MARPDDYPLTRSPVQKGLSATASVLIIAAALSVFQFSPVNKTNRSHSQHQSQLIWFQLAQPNSPKRTIAKQDRPIPKAHQIQKREAEAKRTAITAISSPPPITVEVPAPPDKPSDFDDAFKNDKAIAQALSIKNAGIDNSKIQRAYQDSKTDIEKQAEKSGKTLTDPRLTQQEKFQQAANRAAKPDCLRQGGSLLSLFVVAYQVATDHCK